MTDIERSLTETFDATANALPYSSAPLASWQTGIEAPRSQRQRWRIAAIAGSGLVAAAAAAVVVATALPSGHAGHQVAAGSGSAHALLLAASQSSLNNTAPALAAGQYRYVRTVGPAPALVNPATGASTTTPGSFTLDELWIPKDQNDVWLRRQSVVGDPGAPAATVWQGRCDDLYTNTQDAPKGDACTRAGSFDAPTPAFIAGLPSNATALYAQLHSYAAAHLNPGKVHDANFEMFSTINDLLDSGVIGDDLTSSLYSVLSQIPGVTVVDGAKNASGVAGTGFRLSTTLGSGADATADTETIIVDVHSGAYLGFAQTEPGLNSLDAVSTGVADQLGVAGH